MARLRVLRHGLTRGLSFVATIALGACEPSLQGQAVLPARDLPAYRFTRADGTPFSTGAQDGLLTVLFFGYTHCPDICPTTLANWKRVHAGLGSDTSRVRFVFVSIDPERDTPTIAERYARGYHPSFIGVGGDAPTIWRMVRSYGVAVIPENAPADEHDHATASLIGHSSQTFLLNPKGQLIAMYPTGTSWESLLADLRSLL